MVLFLRRVRRVLAVELPLDYCPGPVDSLVPLLRSPLERGPIGNPPAAQALARYWAGPSHAGKINCNEEIRENP